MEKLIDKLIRNSFKTIGNGFFVFLFFIYVIKRFYFPDDGLPAYIKYATILFSGFWLGMLFMNFIRNLYNKRRENKYKSEKWNKLKDEISLN
jgi:hypothetical protein